MKYPAILFLLCVTVFLHAQPTLKADTLNQVDSLGKRQGYWRITAAMKNTQGFQSPESIVEEGSYLNSEKTGQWISYYPSGKMRSRMYYSRNRPNGTATLYFENGHIQETGTWKGTRWVGEYKMYYENDTLRYQFNYNPFGQKHGMQYSYHPNGKLGLSENYVDGKLDGWHREYDRDGVLILETFYSPNPDSCKTIRYRTENPQPYIDAYGNGDPTGPRGAEEQGDAHPEGELKLPEQENH